MRIHHPFFWLALGCLFAMTALTAPGAQPAFSEDRFFDSSVEKGGGPGEPEEMEAASPAPAEDPGLIDIREPYAAEIQSRVDWLDREADPAMEPALQREIQDLKAGEEMALMERRRENAAAEGRTARAAELEEELDRFYAGESALPADGEPQQPIEAALGVTRSVPQNPDDEP